MTNPVLRFRVNVPSFPDYLENTIGNIVEIERGGSPRPISKYLTDSPDGLNWIKIGDAPKFGNKITATKEKILPSGVSKTRQVKKGDLILSNSMSFGRPYLLEINGCIHDGWLCIKNSKDQFIPEYLMYLLSSNHVTHQYKALAGAGVVTNLNKELVQQVKVHFPCKEEQQKIASFFSTLDEKISLAERKLEALKQLKKGLMQQMFV